MTTLQITVSALDEPDAEVTVSGHIQQVFESERAVIDQLLTDAADRIRRVYGIAAADDATAARVAALRATADEWDEIPYDGDARWDPALWLRNRADEIEARR